MLRAVFTDFAGAMNLGSGTGARLHAIPAGAIRVPD